MSFDPDIQEIVHAFLDEGREVIADTEPILVSLEGSSSPEAIQAVFRAFHSMKGTAGFLGFVAIQDVTHHAETVLQHVRDGELALDRAVVDALCQAMDLIAGRLAAVEATGTDAGDEERVAAVVRRLRGAGHTEPGALRVTTDREIAGERFRAEAPKWLDLADAVFATWRGATDLARADGLADAERALEALGAEAKGVDAASVAALADAASQLLARYRDTETLPNVAACDTLRYTLAVLREALGRTPAAVDDVEGWLADLAAVAETVVVAPKLGELLVAAGVATAGEVADALAAQVQPLGEILVERHGIADEDIDKVVALQRAVRAGDDPPPVVVSGERKKHETLRVDVHKLDLLMDLVGELIIGTTSVIHDPQLAALQLEGFQKSAAQLDRITRALQDVAMSLRMTPVSGTFRKMQRLVRDVANKRGRRVRLEIVGEETEVDKTVAELIADPLVHLLRNAVDHGIEAEADRAAAGKDPEGHIRLEAGHQGGEVLIVVRDDGRGLDRQRIYERAVERGLTQRPLESLSERDLFAFIFEPGFSTAVEVSDISGRGVGMDVARKNIEAVNGRIDVTSVPGKGTTIVLRIPLTLAIIEGMLVQVGDACFTIPLLQIKESFVPRADDITVLHTGQEMVRIRDRLLPVLRLHDFYRIDGATTDLDHGVLVVVEDHGHRVCLLVDHLIGQRQTVIKALSAFVGHLRGISGCTVLGDGRISLILDVGDLERSWSRGAA